MHARLGWQQKARCAYWLGLPASPQTANFCRQQPYCRWHTRFRPVSGLASLGASPSHLCRRGRGHGTGMKQWLPACQSANSSGMQRMMHPHLFTVAGAVRALPACANAAGALGSRLPCLPATLAARRHLKQEIAPGTEHETTGSCMAQSANSSNAPARSLGTPHLVLPAMHSQHRATHTVPCRRTSGKTRTLGAGGSFAARRPGQRHQIHAQ